MAILTGTPGATEILDPTFRSTTQKAPLGSRAWDQDGKEYVYVKAGAVIALNDAVMFQNSAAGFDDVRTISAAAQVTCVGVATAAFASLEFGYVQTRGVCTCKVVVATAAGSALVSGTTTAGTLEISVAGSLQSGRAVALVTGVAAGSAICLL